MFINYINKKKSIKKKFLTIILSISFITMLISALISLITINTTQYLKTQSDLKATTDKIITGVKTYLDVNDNHDLAVFFETLSLETHLDKACYYNHENRLVASWEAKFYECSHSYFDGLDNVKEHPLHIYKNLEVTQKDGNLGHLFIVYDLDDELAAVIEQMIIFILATVLGLFLAYRLTLKFISVISKPIYHLSGIAVTLAEKQDFTIRAKNFSDDEIGLLSDAFNEMIMGMERNSLELQKARKEADDANKQKSAFLAMMSHEIRTPINGVIGTADLLGDTPLTGRQKEYIDVIERSAESLLDIVNDILDFSKIEAHKLKIFTTPFNIINHIQDTIDILHVNVKQKGLQLYFRNHLNIKGDLIGDPVRIRQILINFVSNAIKFTEKGSVTITIDELENDRNDVKNIIIKVSDTGIGIPERYHDTIFDSFTQANDGDTRKYGGTGLGLAICKKLTHMMDGEIGFDSTPNVGTTFWFSLPLPLANSSEEENTPTIEKQPQNDDFDVENMDILFVEDNETNIMITAEMLMQAGYNPVLCRNGQEAVEAYQNSPISLILMDCQMPVMDGWEATEAIRNFEKQNNMPPAKIIALTANAMQGDKEKCLKAGMDNYLAKPFKKKDLLAKLDEVINNN